MKVKMVIGLHNEGDKTYRVGDVFECTETLAEKLGEKVEAVEESKQVAVDEKPKAKRGRPKKAAKGQQTPTASPSNPK